MSAADGSVAPGVIDELAYVLATLADGFGVNWLTYGDASVAREQMDVNCAVLEAWLSSRTAAVPAKPARRKRAARA